MGCGSSVSKNDTGVPELKKPVDGGNAKINLIKFKSTVNGFTNAITRMHILELDSINLIYNDDEDQEVDTPELFLNEKVSVVIKSLRGLTKDSANKHYPKVCYELKGPNDSSILKGDLLAADQGIEAKDVADFKFKFDKIDSLTKGEKYHLQIQIQDKKSNKSAIVYYDYKFYAKASGENGRAVHKRNRAQEHSENANDICVQTRGELVYKKVSLTDGKKAYAAPYIIKYGNKIQLRIEGIKGYVTNEELGNIGLSIFITDDQGKEVYFMEDQFGAENEYHVDELSEISTYIVLGGESFNPETTYTWTSRLWDKLGNSQISVATTYKGDKEVETQILTKEIKTDVPNKCEVKFGGESGFLQDRIGILFVSKDFEQTFRDAIAKESMMVATWVFNPNPKVEEQNVLHFVEKDKKKPAFWRLGKVSAQV